MSCFGGVSLEQKRSMLEDHTPLGAYLASKELGELAKILQLAKFGVGKPLPESPFYVVMSGQVEVREGSDVLCTKSPGAFFTRRAGLVAQQRGSIAPGANRASVAPDPAASRHSIVKSKDADGADVEITTTLLGKVAGKVLWVSVPMEPPHGDPPMEPPLSPPFPPFPRR